MRRGVQTRRVFLAFLPLLLGVVLLSLAVYFFNRLDYVVNGDLYNYGLQFSPNWADRYWTYSGLMLVFMAAVVSAMGMSTGFGLLSIRTKKNYLEAICQSLIFGTIMIAISVFFFSLVNSLVNGDLYRYGLQFSSEWYGQYVTYFYLFLGLLVTTIAINGVSVAYLLSDRYFAFESSPIEETPLSQELLVDSSVNPEEEWLVQVVDIESDKT